MHIAQDETGRIYTDSGDGEASASAATQLWGALRSRRPGGQSFERDQMLGRYPVDFYAREAKLAIQIQADELSESDARIRDVRLEALGIRVVRVSSVEVMRDVAAVVQAIETALSH